jgi:hypothetical protein
VGRRNHRNFVVFSNSICIASALFVYAYFFHFSSILVSNTQYSNNPKLETDLMWKNSVLFLVMLLTEILLPKFRLLSCAYGLYFIASSAILMTEELSVFNIIVLYFFVSACFSFGTSLRYTLEYLKLNYQGFTKKELLSIKNETGRHIKCVDPITGIRNLISFYVHNSKDRENGRSVLREEIIIEKQAEMKQIN